MLTRRNEHCSVTDATVVPDTSASQSECSIVDFCTPQRGGEAVLGLTVFLCVP